MLALERKRAKDVATPTDCGVHVGRRHSVAGLAAALATGNRRSAFHKLTHARVNPVL